MQLRQLLSANIKARRKILGISQEELAGRTKLSVQMINCIEGCRAWVSDKTLTKLAEVLFVEAFQLLSPDRLNEEKTQDTLYIKKEIIRLAELL